MKKEDKKCDAIRDFIVSTGNYKDPGRDNFVTYCTKILRDELTLDQIATEIQYNKKGEPVAFFAVDAATIERVIPEKEKEIIKTPSDLPSGFELELEKRLEEAVSQISGAGKTDITITLDSSKEFFYAKNSFTASSCGNLHGQVRCSDWRG